MTGNPAMQLLVRACSGAARRFDVVFRIVLAGSLGGCAGAIDTNYQRPTLDVPGQWQHEHVEANAGKNVAPAPLTAWWEDFGEPSLSRLVEAALRRNDNLAAATSRVRQADLQVQLAASALRPTPAFELTSGVARAGGAQSRNSSLTASVSYEVELWGRLASVRDAQRWEADATEQDRLSTALALAATTANLYWQLAYLNERLATSADSLAYGERTRALVQAQYRAGAVSALEVRQADISVAGQEALRAELVQRREEVRTALAVLFDAPPGDRTLLQQLPQEPAALPRKDLPEPDAGLPAELLARRPDLRASELRLRGTLANVDAVRASYYPRLTLTGSHGTSSSALTDLLANPVSSLGASLIAPFLRWNDMRLETEISRERYNEAVVGFRQALYEALGEVEDALSARMLRVRQARSLEAQLTAAREVERLYEVRYRSGAATLQVWLDAQEKRRGAEMALSENRLERIYAQIKLYKAMGGTAQH
jgi:NodT family efflux transporter outer membrane factor (OMF) lipoprotein